MTLRGALLIVLAVAVAAAMENGGGGVKLVTQRAGGKLVVDAVAVATGIPEIVSAVACTAIDSNIDSERMCATDGFKRVQVYPMISDDADDSDNAFEGHLRSQSRLVMNARVVETGIPLVYVEVGVKIRRHPDEPHYINNGSVVRSVVRIDRSIREAAAAVAQGRVDTLDVLGPASDASVADSSNVMRRFTLFGSVSLAAMCVAMFITGGVIHRRVSRARRRDRGSSNMIVLVDDDHDRGAKERAKKDDDWAVRNGMLRPRDRGILGRL